MSFAVSATTCFEAMQAAVSQMSKQEGLWRSLMGRKCAFCPKNALYSPKNLARQSRNRSAKQAVENGKTRQEVKK